MANPADVRRPFPRSFLFVPANRSRMIENAFRSSAEAVVLDLEDAVPPDQKAAARQVIAAIVPAAPKDREQLFVRVNAAGTAECDEDLRMAASVPLAGVVVPKVERPEDLRCVGETLDRLEAARGARRLAVIALLETPLGILRAADLAGAAPARVTALALGAEDYRAAMGVDLAEAGGLVDFARAMVATAAAAAGLPAIDTPEPDVRDLERLRRETQRARGFGFRAKFAVHPAQLPVIHDVLMPTSAQREWAERVVRAYEQAAAEGRGSVELDGRMIDAATARRARTLLGLREQD